MFGAWIGINRDLNRYEYDSLIRVLVTLPSRDLQRYEDALPFLSLLVTPYIDLGDAYNFFNFCSDPQQWHHELGLCVVSMHE